MNEPASECQFLGYYDCGSMRPPRGNDDGKYRGGRDDVRSRGGRDSVRFGRGGGGRDFSDRGSYHDEGPPKEVIEVSTFVYTCEGEAVTKLTHGKIPYINDLFCLENKTHIGKFDEIFAPINELLFSIKIMEGIVASSYSTGDKFYTDSTKLLPLSKFLPQPKGQAQVDRCGFRGRGRGRGRGGGGGFRGRGAPFGHGGPPWGGGGFRGRGGRA